MKEGEPFDPAFDAFVTDWNNHVNEVADSLRRNGASEEDITQYRVREAWGLMMEVFGDKWFYQTKYLLEGRKPPHWHERGKHE